MRGKQTNGSLKIPGVHPTLAPCPDALSCDATSDNIGLRREDLLDRDVAAYRVMDPAHTARSVVGADMAGVGAGPKDVGDRVEGERSNGLGKDIALVNERRDLVVGRHSAKCTHNQE